MVTAAQNGEGGEWLASNHDLTPGRSTKDTFGECGCKGVFEESVDILYLDYIAELLTPTGGGTTRGHWKKESTTFPLCYRVKPNNILAREQPYTQHRESINTR